MRITKFDLYKSEWLELVFHDRNKEYGAYYLRQHYANNMVKAMGIAFLGIAVLFGASAILKAHPDDVIITEVPIMPKLSEPPVIEKDKVIPPKLEKPIKVQPPAAPVETHTNPPLVVTSDPTASDPQKAQPGATGPVEAHGSGTEINVLPGIEGGTKATSDPSPDIIYPPIGLDNMPEPVGGAGAWAKFLNKNLHYPNEARDNGVNGRVYMSFVVEKDGSLSNIVVERAAGNGFDEEATRVLKLAKAWKPGKQNGQAVRVKYIIPINFQITE